MNLLNLAPDIQEAMLFLPRTEQRPRPDPPAAVAADRRGAGLEETAAAVAGAGCEDRPRVRTFGQREGMGSTGGRRTGDE